MTNYRIWLFLAVMGISGQNAGTIVPSNLPSSHNGLKITTSETDIFHKVTEHLKVSCTYSKPELSDVKNVTSLVLSRWSVAKGKLEHLVMINSERPKQLKVEHDVGAKASGHLKQDGTSFLSLEWILPDNDAAAQYACLIITKNELGYSLITEVGIYVHLMSNGIAKKLLALKKGLEEQNKKLEALTKLQRELEEQKRKNSRDQAKQNKKLAEQQTEIRRQNSMIQVLNKVLKIVSEDESVLIGKERFYAIRSKLSFHDAKTVCLFTRGKLAESMKYHELQPVADKLKRNKHIEGGWHWIGLEQPSERHPWVWPSSGDMAGGRLPFNDIVPPRTQCASFRPNTGFSADPCSWKHFALCSRRVRRV